MKMFGKLTVTLAALLASASLAQAQSWQALKHKSPINAGAMALLTDGTVMVHSEQDNSAVWYKLTPDNRGSYINGNWKKAASLPTINGTPYLPLYFGIAVLPDGRLLIEGGEYNNGNAVWTNLGAIYDPAKNAWTAVKPPNAWANIGDAQTAILNDGTLLLADCCDYAQALLKAKKLTWLTTGKGKADWNDEEGWTLLPNGSVLTVDSYVSPGKGKMNSEIYNPKTGKWSSAGSTLVQLWGESTHGQGPDIMMTDGTVFCTGANDSGAGHTAIYNSKTGKWSLGPDFPDNLDISDGPGALEVNGNALVMASPGVGDVPATFFEWDGNNLNQVSGPPNASNDSSYFGHFLTLPSGQIMFTDFTNDVEIFAPSGTYQSAWQPTISSAPSKITRGKSYVIQGTQFNGYSQAGFYGDDYQAATNYPLVRIVNNKTKHVFYATTTNPSTMGIQTGSATVSTNFFLPKTAEKGASSLYVVANGIPSAAMKVTVQ